MEQTKGPSSQSCSFSSGHVWMWELDYKESWVLKNWCFWTVVLEQTLESPLDCQEIQPVHPKGNQSWIVIGRKLQLQYLGHLMWRADSLEKTPMLGKIEARRRRGRQKMRGLDVITDSMDVSLSKLGVGDGLVMGSLVCCSPWGCKEWDMTDWATELKWNRERKDHMSLNAFVGIKRHLVLAGSSRARPLCSAVSPAGRVLVLTLWSSQYISEKCFLMHFHFGQLHLFHLFLSSMCVLNGNSYFLKYVCDLTCKSETGKWQVRKWTGVTLRWQ